MVRPNWGWVRAIESRLRALHRSDQMVLEPATAPASVPDPANASKQAIILVHGMGEQTPMETLRGFVKTVW